MILTPGVAITNSLRDIMGSDHISGMARMLEALLTATFYCNWGWNNDDGLRRVICKYN